MNTRRSIVIELNDERMSLFEFSQRLNIPWSTIYKRVRIRHQEPIAAARAYLLKKIA